jgi:ATP-binding cassette subfamily B protein
MRKRFPFFPQHDAMDCGPACLQMVAAWHGQRYALGYLREHSYVDREGVSLAGIQAAATQIGMDSMPVRIPFSGSGSLEQAELPCIVHWEQRHFVVVYRIGEQGIWLADPAKGRYRLSREAFLQGWQQDGDEGLALFLRPGADFGKGAANANPGLSIWKHLRNYLLPYRALLVQVFIGLLLGALLQLSLPFLAQSVVDIGIQNQDIGFLWLILLAQVALLLSMQAERFLRSWILLHLSTRLQISILSDFLEKLMRLPSLFFERRFTGDLLQRIDDHQRVEELLTGGALNTLFSAIQLLVFGLVLYWYQPSLFFWYLLGSLLFVLWVLAFMPRRALLDARYFEQSADHQHVLLEVLQGMPEIQLQGSETKHKQRWLEVQANLFKTRIDGLQLAQWQELGATFFLQVKDILLSILAARAVVQGELSLGMLLAVQFMIGYLHAPLSQLLQFLRSAQDARISFERMQEVQTAAPAHKAGKALPPLPADLLLENLTFRYSPLDAPVLEDIQLRIPAGQVTAIVGSSGSGKTTLLKLLLGMYPPSSGRILVGDTELPALETGAWAQHCGAVLQGGYVFSDTLLGNITESEQEASPNPEQLRLALHGAVLDELVEQLPRGLHTQVGARGKGLSQGQTQRLLLARALYKNPAYLFLDEATNALDAHTERLLLERLQQLYHQRTVVVIAHRLSTVRKAHQIVVLEGGKLVEVGNHEELLAKKGIYYHLVREQL